MNASHSQLSNRSRADEFEQMLHRHVVETWFPRSIDTTHGGFLCDFDRAWRSCGPHDKLLEFQARHTMFSAEASQAYPDVAVLREATDCGLHWLRNVMWDSECGGWFHLVGRDGTPLLHGTKHSHGIAYAIQACCAAYEATGQSQAAELACAGFEWLDRHAHDPVHGGYFGYLARNGAVIRAIEDAPDGKPTDPIGTAVGLKDMNVHSDLIEALISLHGIWPDRRVRQRLDELMTILTEKLITEGGALHYYFEPDFRPIPHLERIGNVLQTAYRLHVFVEQIEADAELSRKAFLLLDHALDCGWDWAEGGFVYAAPAASPAICDGETGIVGRKEWWVQLDGLKAVTTLLAAAPDNRRYAAAADALVDFLKARLLDHRYGGVFTSADGLDVGRGRWRRHLRALKPDRRGDRNMLKGHMWKDASHDGRTLLSCIRTLRKPHARHVPRGSGADDDASAERR